MKETGLSIRIYGDKALRRKARPLKRVDSEERRLAEEMVKIMHANSGVGLAAPQVGVNKQIIVVDIGNGPFKLFNPRIKQKKGSCSMEEGCLSLPGISVNVKRAKEICVDSMDESGKKLSMQAEDLLARAIQHEVDHLRGKLIVDYADIIRKFKIKRAFKQKLKNKMQL